MDPSISSIIQPQPLIFLFGQKEVCENFIETYRQTKGANIFS